MSSQALNRYSSMQSLSAEERTRFEDLEKKYREEQQKRIRKKPAEQGLPPTESLARLKIDPHADPEFSREPIVKDVEVAIVGGGLCGMMSAVRLHQQGIDDILIIENGADFGGTWYWNRYPGCRCDTESYIYIPMLEELNYVPTEKFASASEIFEHGRAVAKHFNLYERACFQTAVTDVSWNGAKSRWIIRTSRQDTIEARFVVLSVGALTLGRLPAIPGEEKFKGHVFHSSRWDYDYTGGGPNGVLPNLADKSVAVVGTAATAVQLIPFVAAAAKTLYVVQRTPTVVLPRENPKTDPEWANNLTPGWQSRRRDSFEAALAGQSEFENGVADGWLEIFGPPVPQSSDEAALAPTDFAQVDDYRRLDRVRAHVESVVEDSTTAEALKPYYNRFCKRPTFSNAYYQTFNRSNVHLIDTQGGGIDQLTEHEMVVNGKQYPVDCIVYATGFEIAAAPDRAGGFELHGRDGLTLSEKWAGGRKTLFGLLSRGFPNLFMIGNVRQASVSVNSTDGFGAQSKLLAQIIARSVEAGAKTIEVSQEAEEAWVHRLHTGPLLDYYRAITAGCTPGIYNDSGRADTLFTDTFTEGPVKYREVLESWIESGYDRDLEVKM